MTKCPMCKYIFDEEKQSKRDFRVVILKELIEEFQKKLTLIEHSDDGGKT